MSEKISGIITDFLLRKNVIKEEEKEIYHYGYETLIYRIEFRRKRHDLKHQMTEVLSLLQNKQYEKLERCIKELTNLKSLEGLKIANIENSIVDAFINYKYEMAKKNGIEFRVKLDIPTRLPFENGDLGIILGNALDNALEANLRSRWKNLMLI